jgi:glucose-6-phosphate 1-epimerase
VGQVTPVRYRGADAIELTSPEAGSAVVLLHGGHVVSWKDPAGQERLYLSPLSDLSSDKAVRGGVPVIFPQFSERGPGPRHGFARTRRWHCVASDGGSDGCPSVSMALESSEATHALWPEAFRIELKVALSPGVLDLQLTVSNVGPRSWKFAGALHSYLAVESIGAVHLAGLQGLRFEDALRAGATSQQSSPTLRPKGAIDRIYFDAAGPFSLKDRKHSLSLAHQGWPDVVVWNPGIEGARALGDLPDADWARFVCVEAALIGAPQILQPGEQWQGRQTLRAEPHDGLAPPTLV